MEKREKITISVEATNITGKLMLVQEIGRGSYGDHVVDLLTALPTMSPIVVVEGQRWLVDVHDIVKAVCANVVGEIEDLG